MRCNSWTCNTLIQSILFGQGLARFGILLAAVGLLLHTTKTANGNLTSTECERASRWISKWREGLTTLDLSCLNIRRSTWQADGWCWPQLCQ